MEQYPSNSIKHRKKMLEKEQQEKRLKSVVKQPAVKRKKSEIRKFTDEFITESVSKVNNHIFKDILFPSIKEIIWKVLTDSVNMIFYPNDPKRSSVPASRVSYRDCYGNTGNASPIRDYSSNSRTASDLAPDECIFMDRGSAEIVLYRLQEELNIYGLVTVADFKQLSGIHEEYTDNNFGWTNLKTCKVLPTNGGYYIRLPKPYPID